MNTFSNLQLGIEVLFLFTFVFMLTAIHDGAHQIKRVRDIILIHLRRIRLARFFIACVMMFLTLCVFIPTKVIAQTNHIGSGNSAGLIISPRKAILMNNWLICSNAAIITTNCYNDTPLLLTPGFQHNLTIGSMLYSTNTTQGGAGTAGTNAATGGTNITGSGAFSYTNFFDLGSILSTNGVSTTNWTQSTAITVVGTGLNLSNDFQTWEIPYTNFDSYDLIRLTKFSSNATNQYTQTLYIEQTP